MRHSLSGDGVRGDGLRIERAVKRCEEGRSKIGWPRSPKSIAKVYLPDSLQVEFDPCVQPKSRDDYLFASRDDTRKDAHRYLHRHLKPLAEKLHVPGLTFQLLRCIFATLTQGKGHLRRMSRPPMRHKDALMAPNNYTQPSNGECQEVR